MDEKINKIKKFYKFAGIYGFLALLPQYFMEIKNGIDFPPPITHTEYYYGFIGVALAWQFAFFILSTDPIKYKLIILPAIFEKVSFGIPCILLYLQGKLSNTMLLAAIIDLILMSIFIVTFKMIPDKE